MKLSIVYVSPTFKLSLLGAYKGLKHDFLKAVGKEVIGLLGAYKGLKPATLYLIERRKRSLLGAYKGLKHFV